MLGVKLARAAVVAAATVGLLAASQAMSANAQSTQPKVSYLATASKASISSSAEKKLRATWKAYGVSKTTQNKLLAKARAGKKWDSLLKKRKVTKTRSYKSGGFKVRVRTFVDGSIRVTKIQLPKKPASTMRLGLKPALVSGCTSSSTHYSYTAKGCIVSVNYVLYQIYMKVDYGSVQASISKVRSAISKAYHYGGYAVLMNASWDAPVRLASDKFEMRFSFSNALFSGTSYMVVQNSGISDLKVTDGP